MEFIMQDNLNKYLTEIEFLHQQQLYRKPITYIPISATKVLKDNEEFLMMASNNYLGLTHHPQVKKAAIDAIEKSKATVNYGIFTSKVSIEQLEYVQPA